MTTPLGHSTQWSYNALGIETSRTDAMGRTTTYTLDAWDRTIQITYPDNTIKTFSYDANSNLTSFSDITGTTTRTYDADNRLTQESHNGSLVASYTYDGAGEKGLLSALTDASGRTLSYTYTARNEIASISEPAGTTSYSYDAAGNLISETRPNGVQVTRTYDADNHLLSVMSQTSNNITLASFSYVYDVDGRRTSVTEADGSVVSYSYDGAGRLVGETRTGSSPYSISYTLDGEGNRLSETVNGVTTTFSYDADDELLSTSGGFNNSYSYDANGEQVGRTVGGVSYTLSYDFDGELVGISSANGAVGYRYDALGRRISRTAGGVTTSFVYDAAGQVLLEVVGSTVSSVYTWGVSGLIRKDGEYPLVDGLGSERVVTNSTQGVTASVVYDGFGNVVAHSGSSSDPYQFAGASGYRNDGDAGLTLVGARYYDAQVGRFITRDTYLDQKPYLYCEHDPINALDPSGHDGTGGVSTPPFPWPQKPTPPPISIPGLPGTITPGKPPIWNFPIDDGGNASVPISWPPRPRLDWRVRLRNALLDFSIGFGAGSPPNAPFPNPFNPPRGVGVFIGISFQL